MTSNRTIEVPEFQTTAITEEMMREARQLIGVWLRRDVHWPALTEPISAHDIRRWALYSVGDDNPLWTDRDYGSRSVWGDMIAPPTFLYAIDTTIAAPGLPGVQWIYGGTRWRFHRPVRVGDSVTARARVIDLQDKSTPERQLVVQTGEILYWNQRDELVARAEADLLRIPRRRSGKGLAPQRNDRRESARYSSDQIDEIRRAYIGETRRGAETRYWEDVTVTDIEPVVKGPLTMVDIVGFYAGRRTVYPPLKAAFLQRERHPKNVYVSPSTGIPVHPAAGHMDAEIAQEVGMPRPYDQGWMRINWMSHLLTNWMGDFAQLRGLDVRLSKLNLLGDTTWCRGRVTGKSVRDGHHLVDLEVWGENQLGERTVEARGLVQLPSRDPSDQFAPVAGARP